MIQFGGIIFLPKEFFSFIKQKNKAYNTRKTVECKEKILFIKNIYQNEKIISKLIYS